MTLRHTVLYLPSGVTLQTVVPTSDVTTGTWTASTGVALYPMIDEDPNPDDSDYIQSKFVPLGDACEVRLAVPATVPDVTTDHSVWYRTGVVGTSDVNLAVELYCGGLQIKSWSHTPLPSALTTYQQTLSSGEAATIGDYTNLRLRFTATRA